MMNRVRYYIKRPEKGRVSFSILKDMVSVEGRRKAELVRDERIVSLNLLMKRGIKDRTSCEIEMENILKELNDDQKRKRGQHTFNSENRYILEEYWKAKYQHRQNMNLQSAKDELVRAIEGIGLLSLSSASRDDLQKRINSQFKGNRQRRVAGVINRMLKYIDRDVQLIRAKKEVRRIMHLTLEEFKKVIKKIPEPEYQLFFKTCFATGMRTGEAFAINEGSLKGDVLYIETQLDRDEILRETKNRRQRHAVVNPYYLEDVRQWIALDPALKSQIRGDRHSDILKKACMDAGFSTPQKVCSVIDLRHSYAIWLLSKGVSMTLIAQSLGNSIVVCQEHYAGFVLEPESIKAIKTILGSEIL